VVDDDDAIRRARQQEELWDDIAEVDSYAREIDDEFGGSWVAVERDPVRLVLAVTGDPDRHRDAIAGRLEYPDRLDVVSVAQSHAQLRALQREVETDLEETATLGAALIDPTRNVVVVRLHEAEATFVDELRLRYGDRIAVEVVTDQSEIQTNRAE
jgi:hypothetical protein